MKIKRLKVFPLNARCWWAREWEHLSRRQRRRLLKRPGLTALRLKWAMEHRQLYMRAMQAVYAEGNNRVMELLARGGMIGSELFHEPSRD